MARIYPIVKKTTVVAGGGTDATWTDSTDTDDAISGDNAYLDTVDVGEEAVDVIEFAPADSVDAAETVASATLPDGAVPESVATNDRGVGTIDQARPPANTYVDEGDSANHPHEAPDPLPNNLLAKAATPLLDDAMHAYVWWDLRNMDVFDFHSTGDVSFDVTKGGAAAVSATLFWELRKWSSGYTPPGEYAATWDSHEAGLSGGTLLTSGSVTVQGGATNWQRFNPSQIQSNHFDSASGGWLVMRFLGDTGVGGDLVEFRIRPRLWGYTSSPPGPPFFKATFYTDGTA